VKLVYQGNGAQPAGVELIDGSHLFGFQMLRVGSHRRESVKNLLFQRPVRVVLRDGILAHQGTLSSDLTSAPVRGKLLKPIGRDSPGTLSKRTT
jgi:chemotaxis receptor (MCP) glutamine deamidase CheD